MGARVEGRHDTRAQGRLEEPCTSLHKGPTGRRGIRKEIRWRQHGDVEAPQFGQDPRASGLRGFVARGLSRVGLLGLRVSLGL